MFRRILSRIVRRRRGLMGERREYLRMKEEARMFIRARIAVLAPLLHVHPARIAIRNTRARWGSCSSLGNLNFHYRIMMLPLDLRDYIIIHELCHLRHMDHSPRFWGLVATVVPDHAKKRRHLRTLERRIAQGEELGVSL